MGTAAVTPHPSETAPQRRRILLCLDRSTSSEVCVPYALSLAKTFGSAITIVHVMHSHQDQAGPHTSDALSWELSRQEARAYLDRIEKDVSRSLGSPVDVRLEQGHPAERILDVAHEIDADLTVLGSHGDALASPWNLGSTIQQVLAVTRRSVLVVRSSSVVPRSIPLRRVLVPLDGSLRTESALPSAARIACAHGAELLLVHVVHEPLPSTVLYSADDIALAQKLAEHLESGAKGYLERLQHHLARDVPSVRTMVVRHANERQCLLDIAQREQADLIVLSAHGSACDSAQTFGSVATYLVNNSMVPLLVLQDLPEGEIYRPNDVDGRPTLRSPRASFAPEGA